jgi:4,5-DOPA dioxygenase extradiol
VGFCADFRPCKGVAPWFVSDQSVFNFSGFAMNTAPLALSQFQSLRSSDRLPVVFLGHGSPMNVITDNPWKTSWQQLGQEFGSRWPMPQLILCISAHWLTEGWALTAMDRPRTIHDFGGFPQELFDQQYPAPGAPAAAAEIGRFVRQRASRPLDMDQQWGLDHGAWGVLKPMFPEADIPVIQLSMDYQRPPADHYALAQQLRGLRDKGVLDGGQRQHRAQPAHDAARGTARASLRLDGGV